MTQSLRTLLANDDLFEAPPDDVLAEFSWSGTTLTHRPARVLIQQGSPEAGPQLVVDGSAEVSVDGVVCTTMAPGAYFGEISLLNHQPRSVTVTAGPVGPPTFALSRLEFSGMMDERPEMVQTLLVPLCARIRRVQAAQRPADS